MRSSHISANAIAQDVAAAAAQRKRHRIRPSSEGLNGTAPLPAQHDENRNPPKRAPQAAATLVIVIAPVDGVRFTASLHSKVLCTSRAPLLSAARVLRAQGYSKDCTLVMRHAGSPTDALRADLGVAATLTVNEAAHGPVFRRHKTQGDGPQPKCPETLLKPPSVRSMPAPGLGRPHRQANALPGKAASVSRATKPGSGTRIVGVRA